MRQQHITQKSYKTRWELWGERLPVTYHRSTKYHNRQNGRLCMGQCCHRCRKASHMAPNCRFKDSKCYQCGKKGHLRSVCRNKMERDNLRTEPYSLCKRRMRVHCIKFEEAARHLLCKCQWRSTTKQWTWKWILVQLAHSCQRFHSDSSGCHASCRRQAFACVRTQGSPYLCLEP